MSATAAASGRGFGRSAGTLSTGVGVAGLLTYVFFSLASHNLDAAAYGEIVVLWSAVFVTISVLHRPVEQFISRSVAEHGARREPIGGTLRAAATVQAGVAVLFLAVVLVARGPLEDDLFSGESTIYWVYVTSVLCFAVSFFARGYLAGRGGFGLLAGLLVCESVARTAFALAVAVGIASGQDVIALGVVAAPIFSLIVVPVALSRRRGEDAAADREPPVDPRKLARGTAFTGAVFLIMLAEQAFLNTGPLLARGFEDAAAAGYIFNVLMLARAPLLVFQGVAISLLPHLTRLRSRGDGTGAEAFEVSITTTLRAVAAFTAFVVLVVAVAGPDLMQAAFGDRFTYDRGGLLIVAVAMGFYLASTTLTQAALAQGKARRAAIAWLACAAAFVAWALLPVVDDIDVRIEIGFGVGSALLCAALWRVYRAPADGEGPAPGSIDETAARTALADEAS
jgi:O-antigen/teichoic acid export membrane protein